MSHIFAKIKDHYRFKFESTFLVLFNKYGQDNEITSGIELFATLKFTHILTQSETDKINFQWTLENGIKSVEVKEYSWNFQRTNTMGISFCKSGEFNGST